MRVMGVDPGSKRTGVVVLDIDGRDVNVVHRAVLARTDAESIDEYAESCAMQIIPVILDKKPAIVGVEAFKAPSPFRGMVAPLQLVETSFMVGHTYRACYCAGTTVLVEPGGHGDHPISTYPDALVGPRETTGTGKSPWQHARSAHDVALAAVGTHRLKETA